MWWPFRRKKENEEDKESTSINLPAPLSLEEAVLFNSLKEEDQSAVIWIYNTKRAAQELKSDNYIAALEEVSKLYLAQQCAFDDVLTKEGFESAEKILRTYAGRIAFLTEHGSLGILGKAKEKGRHITLTRIHTLKWNWNHQRGVLSEDMVLGKAPRLYVFNAADYSGSYLRALAINPHGADGDELVVAEEIVTGIGEKTEQWLLNPKEKVKIGEQNEPGLGYLRL